MSASAWAVTAVLTMTIAPVAAAADTSVSGTLVTETANPRQPHVDAALKAYENNAFEAAAKHFERAYRAEGRSDDLYNAGRAYEAADDPAQARAFYLRFLATHDLPQTQRQQTEARLAALPDPPPISAAVETTPTRAVAKDDVSATRSSSRGRPRLHWTTSVGIGLASAGVASMVTGGVFAATAVKNASNAAGSTAPNQTRQDTPQQGLAQRQAKLADAMLIAGGVALAVSLVFVLSGLERRRRTRSASRQLRLDRGAVTLSF